MNCKIDDSWRTFSIKWGSTIDEMEMISSSLVLTFTQMKTTYYHNKQTWFWIDCLVSRQRGLEQGIGDGNWIIKVQFTLDRKLFIFMSTKQNKNQSSRDPQGSVSSCQQVQLKDCNVNLKIEWFFLRCFTKVFDLFFFLSNKLETRGCYILSIS